MTAEIPLPLTASIQPEKNIGVEKVLYTGRIKEYPLGEQLEIARIFPPWTVGLSPTSRCTRTCFFCSHQGRNRRGEFLTEEKTEELITDLRDSLRPKGAILAGGGEPTFWEGDLASVIHALSEFCSVGIDTNGTLLDKFLRNGAIWRLFYLTVPILGYDRKSYQSVCEHDQFDIVDRNLREILSAKRERKLVYPYVNLKVAINQRSYKDLVPLLRYAESIGADNTFIRVMNNFEGRTDIDLTQEQRQIVYEMVTNEPGFEGSYIRIFAQNLVNPHSRSVEQQTPVLPSHCWTVMLMHNMGIKPNGDVFLCVPTTDQEEFSIGNVNKMRLTEMWGNERHLEVIRELDERMGKGLCDLRKCRHYRLNIVLEMVRRGEIRMELPEEQFLERHGPFL